MFAKILRGLFDAPKVEEAVDRHIHPTSHDWKHLPSSLPATYTALISDSGLCMPTDIDESSSSSSTPGPGISIEEDAALPHQDHFHFLHDDSSSNFLSFMSDSDLDINPANGLPMVGAFDIGGNMYGFDDSFTDWDHDNSFDEICSEPTFEIT
nr:hypothetical protein [uncultured Halomonas sp.]